MKEKLFLAFLVILGIAGTSPKALGADPVAPSLSLLPAPATEADLQAGGVFYVLNVGSGKFLTRTVGNNNYGTRSSVAGFISTDKSLLANDSYQFTIAGNASDGYTFYSYGINNSNQQKNGYLFATDYNVWVDQGSDNAASKWAVTATQDGAFSIKSKNVYAGDADLFYAPQNANEYALCYSNTSIASYADYIDWKFYKVSESTAYINAVKNYELELYEGPRLSAAIMKAEKLLAEQSDATLLAAVNAAKSSTADQYKAQTVLLYAAITSYLSSLETIYTTASPVTLENPDLTANFAGWTQTVAGGAGSGVAEFFERTNATFSQTVSCQPGSYKLIAQAFYRPAGNSMASINEWATTPLTASLYAISGGVTSSAPVPSLYSIPGNTQLSGHWNGYANGTGSAATVFGNGYYPVEFNFLVEAAGDVTIGLNSGPTGAARWICFDSFKLIRLGDLPSTATLDQLNELAALGITATGLLAQVMEAVVSSNLSACATAGAAINVASTIEEAQEAIDNLKVAISDATSSISKYAALKTALDAANATKLNFQSYSGYADFLLAISTAQGIYDDAVTADLTDAIAALKASERVCRLTESPSADFTWVIANPGFEDGNGNDGWAGTLGSTNTTSFVNFNGRFMEVWTGSGALANKDAYQVLEGLPEGYYSLSAAVIAVRQSDLSLAVSGVSLYAGENSVASYTGNGFPKIFEVPAVYVADGGSLRIGLKIESTDANWVAMDNFKLMYHGMHATQELIDELKEQTDRAANLVPGDISPAADALTEITSQNLSYEAGVTSVEVVTNAIQVMKDAIETYRSAYIKNYSFEAFQDEFTTGVKDVQNWTRSTTDGYNWSGCNGDWKTDGYRSFGIYKDAIDSDFELSQVVTVPNGMYLVSVDMTVSKSGATSRVNGQRLFAGHAENYYPDYQETDADNGAATTLSVLTVVNDGQLKLGVRTNGGTKLGIGWFKIDNFAIKKVANYTNLDLIDWMDFNATENQTINVSYIRTFMTTGVNSTTTNGWQSLCLPFDVTKIEIADTYSQRYIDLTDKANEKFWLYKITESGYTPAYSIEAHEYYLIALPNDEDYYATGVSLCGDVTFYGTEVLATPVLPQVELPLFYVQANFKSTNPGYGITDVDNNSVFKQYHNNGTFWVHALPKDGNGSFTTFNVFGPTDPTSLRQTDMGDAVSQLVVVNVEGGLEIKVAVSQMIRMYTTGGELVKALKVPAGTTRISLPVGQYIVNGQKVVVNK